MITFVEQFKLARRAAAPLIAVTTPDPASTVGTIMRELNGSTALLQWDMARGLAALNGPGNEVLMTLMGENDPAMLTNPTEMLSKAAGLPEKAILFCLTLHPYLEGKDKEPSVVQAIWNLRDSFKSDKRTLVLLCPQITLPPELAQDVIILDEPLPDASQLASIARDTFTNAGVPIPKPEIITNIVEAVSGLATFAAETCCAMSVRKEGMDMDSLWERKRQMIEQTPGLSVWRGQERFASLGGCENSKKFCARVINGKNRPLAVVFIDEIEKAVAGMGGLDGTTAEMVGTLLTYMQDKRAKGILKIGPPGAAKSAMAKAIGNEAGIPTIVFDLSGMKGSLVGQSGANMRAALKVVEAVAQGRALFVATCNAFEALSPELRRRFKLGMFFYDLPDKNERALIWKIYLTKYELAKQPMPNDTGWTGAEIENCCEMASDLGISLLEAATYIVPVSVSAGDRIKALRLQANGKFISAGAPGTYKAPDEVTGALLPTTTRRQIDVGKDKE